MVWLTGQVVKMNSNKKINTWALEYFGFNHLLSNLIQQKCDKTVTTQLMNWFKLLKTSTAVYAKLNAFVKTNKIPNKRCNLQVIKKSTIYYHHSKLTVHFLKWRTILRRRRRTLAMNHLIFLYKQTALFGRQFCFG